MAFLAILMRAINRLNIIVGHVFSWLAVGIFVVCFWVVIERYFFGNTRLWMQDLYVWLNGAMFTAVAAFALYRNDHVRVDIFFRTASIRSKAIMDMIGVCLFLLPFMYIVWIYSYPNVMRSWSGFEASANVGGMPGLFVLRTFILAFAGLVALQGIAMLIRSVLILAGREDLIPDDFRYKYETE
ncbi:MAG: TRAP transporter small permease subunit [Paracoccaceae bacterium]|uniref:TRAP transporter small permease subunit n=1 Tax=Seohaeicola saemankumensis TaxID=481181 RepID=UPI001E6143F4|nr:TRAP transporter small permease subunit [Seohaeicola saemankumensis]